MLKIVNLLFNEYVIYTVFIIIEKLKFTHSIQIIYIYLSIYFNMTKFIQFAKVLVNTSNIIKVDILPNKYIIFMSNNNFTGGLRCCSGGLNSHENKFVICKMEKPYDYLIMEKWITQVKMEVYTYYSTKI